MPTASRPAPRLSAAHKRVIQVNATDPRWDDFVVRAPGATVYHHSGWLTALQHESRQPLVRFAYEEPDGTLSGILPLMVTRGLPLRLGGASAAGRLSSLPRTPVAGPVAASQAVRSALIETAIDHASSAGLRLQLKQAPGALDDPAPDMQASPWRPSYFKELPDDPDKLRFGNSRNHSRIMWAVRKAQREGLEVRPAATETDLRNWYRLYLDVNRWRGLPSRPYRLFRAAWEHLSPGGFLRLLLVHQWRAGRDVLLAGSMLLMLGDTAFYAFNGRLRDALPLRPNELLQWHAMRDAAAASHQWYDFGEVEEGNSGLAAFKAKWDTQTRTLIRYHAPPVPGDSTGYRGTGVQGWPGRVALRAWHHVPLGVTALAGDWIYRYL
ncbi:MAG TPA: GNAT family N-acetyltransferase [Streptosporangiaceae bacterium]|nr:GNAT family N-acetyltransferase [Streptosporangiaceae bacterium]